MRVVGSKTFLLMLAVALLMLTTVLFSACMRGETAPDTNETTVSSCVSCHQNQQELMAVAARVEGKPEASSGEG